LNAIRKVIFYAPPFDRRNIRSDNSEPPGRPWLKSTVKMILNTIGVKMEMRSIFNRVPSFQNILMIAKR
jgi:hypothetical protein